MRPAWHEALLSERAARTSTLMKLRRAVELSTHILHPKSLINLLVNVAQEMVLRLGMDQAFQCMPGVHRFRNVLELLERPVTVLTLTRRKDAHRTSHTSGDAENALEPQSPRRVLSVRLAPHCSDGVY
ncbi:hypothetical protein BDZ89DRAFT_1068595 [Hymenopellis radicata]|nr:hypothetical protein BDZ89DRAFT_1068595 [Hymenopellis radicata]